MYRENEEADLERLRLANEALDKKIAEMTRPEDGWFVVEELTLEHCFQRGCGVKHYVPHPKTIRRTVRVLPKEKS